MPCRIGSAADSGLTPSEGSWAGLIRPGIRLSCGRMSERGESSPTGLRSTSSFQLQQDQPIEVRRSLDAIGRARWMIVAFVVATTAVVVAISLYVPKTYRSSSQLIYEPATSLFASTDPDTVKRNLETFQRLLTTHRVLQSAAERVPGETADSLKGKVTASVDQSADIISIAALASKPELSARIANAAAATFVELHKQGRPPSARGGPGGLGRPASRRPSRAARLRQELDAVRQQQANLSTELATAGSDLSTVPAEVPDAPYTPRPVRNGVLAFFAALFLGDHRGARP